MRLATVTASVYEVLELLIEVWKVLSYIVEVEKLFQWQESEQDGKRMKRNLK